MICNTIEDRTNASTCGFRPLCSPRAAEISMLVVSGALHSDTTFHSERKGETEADQLDGDVRNVDDFEIAGLRAVVAELVHRNAAEIAIEDLGEVLENLAAATILFVLAVRHHAPKFLQIVVDHRRVLILANQILRRFLVLEVELENAVGRVSVATSASRFYQSIRPISIHLP